MSNLCADKNHSIDSMDHRSIIDHMDADVI